MKKVILFFCGIMFSLFLIPNNLFAEEIGNNLKDNYPNGLEEKIPEKKIKEKAAKSSIEEMFGDEQTFPFVAGLGKNAAH